MAAPQKKLGRGLGNIIAGGAQKKAESPGAAPAKKSATPSKKPAPKKRHKKEMQQAPAVRGAKKTTSSAHTPAASTEYYDLPIEHIEQSPYQMRREFDEQALHELAESIRAEGLLQPITARPLGHSYQLIAGERRLRACKKIGLNTIRARVLDVTDSSSAALALIENLQREDLNPIDEALGYASLMEDHNITQEQVAERVGKGRANVANHLRLLQLNKECQGYVNQGSLKFGHARALISVHSSEAQSAIARQIIEKELNVRAAEKLVQQWRNGGGLQTAQGSSPASHSNTSNANRNTYIENLESQLASHLNAKVALNHGNKKGQLKIEYYGNEDLQRILEKIGFRL